ncbi:MAG: radical SAM protein, partial [Christensenellales bacterium]
AFAGYDIAPSMRGLIDTISISLNAPSAKEYQELCQSVYGEQAYTHVLEFAKSCIAQGIETVLTVVDVIGKEKIEQCKQIAQRTGAKFRLRQYLN